MRELIAIAALAIAAPAAAQGLPDSMTPGPVFPFGPVAEVESDMPIPADAEFRIVFDLSDAAAAGQASRGLVTLARFHNMHVRAGMPRDRIHLAVVVHGAASADLLAAQAYAGRKDGAANANAAIVAALLDKGVRVIMCGQSAAAMGIAREDLLPGVEMALSAMTAHALLQQQGYTVNPF
ncbi:DsrE family protein [Croceicoccus marinus]|uniref:Uncharacterized protein n=1 Tax=Croceicoccus marinus TaxID=450378 RepID=A0A1Z1F7Z3_9SPHN|nr:DsrE family protein [Croceicoccus marinus]ARU14855.1 hypothetical protein A9D14_00090 [Croceicoccus marinus]